MVMRSRGAYAESGGGSGEMARIGGRSRTYMHLPEGFGDGRRHGKPLSCGEGGGSSASPSASHEDPALSVSFHDAAHSALAASASHMYRTAMLYQ